MWVFRDLDQSISFLGKGFLQGFIGHILKDGNGKRLAGQDSPIRKKITYFLSEKNTPENLLLPVSFDMFTPRKPKVGVEFFNSNQGKIESGSKFFKFPF